MRLPRVARGAPPGSPRALPPPGEAPGGRRRSTRMDDATAPTAPTNQVEQAEDRDPLHVVYVAVAAQPADVSIAATTTKLAAGVLLSWAAVALIYSGAGSLVALAHR